MDQFVDDIPSRVHRYTSRGTYNVTITAKNLLTEKDNFTVVILEDELRTLSIKVDTPSEGCIATQICDFELNLFSGSDFQCSYDFGDGTPKEISAAMTLVTDLNTFQHTYDEGGVSDLILKVDYMVKFNRTFNDDTIRTNVISVSFLNLEMLIPRIDIDVESIYFNLDSV